MPSITIEGRRTKDNVVTWLDANVLEAAKQRLRRIFTTFDSVAVAFSGGKDSLTALHLTRDVMEELKIPGKLPVIFRDEEVIPDCVIDFVASYREVPWIDLRWFAVPMKSTKYILGTVHSYVQWDPARPHVRAKPPWAITDDSLCLDQYTMDDYTARGLKGKVCVVTGIRAAESMYRYQAVIGKKNEPAVCNTSSTRIMMGRPLYDWQEEDIFRYFFDRKIAYCSIYDSQTYNSEKLRVATPFLAESAKTFLLGLRTRDPEFLDRILRVFPDVGLQERYFEDYDLTDVVKRYPPTFDGVRQFIEAEVTDPKQRKIARHRLADVMRIAKRTPDTYPPEYVLRKFATGAYKRYVAPLKKAEQASRARRLAREARR